jgi:hypothetical protein
MAHEEAAFNSRHSVVSEKQNQHQRPFTAEPLHGADAEDAKGKEGVQQRAEALAVKLAQTYEELTRLLERNPAMKRQITEGVGTEDKVYQKLKQRLKMADMAPRCQWVRQDGTSCGSPQMKQHIYCFAHMQMAEARELMLRLPPPEDANAIQVGIMRIQKSLIEGTISTKIAGLLLYSMQLALTNVAQVTFGKAKDEEMVRETVDEEAAFREKETPTTETRRHGEEPGQQKPLPLMDADERGLKARIEPVEWKPTPDMYRMDTPEGRAAYEERFGMKNEPWLDRAGTPLGGIVPHQHAEPLPKGPRFASEPLEASTQGSAFQAEPCAVLG